MRWHWPALPRPDVDLRDLHVYAGLGVAALGGWELSRAWTLVALGLILTAMGVFVPRKGGP